MGDGEPERPPRSPTREIAHAGRAFGSVLSARRSIRVKTGPPPPPPGLIDRLRLLRGLPLPPSSTSARPSTIWLPFSLFMPFLPQQFIHLCLFLSFSFLFFSLLLQLALFHSFRLAFFSLCLCLALLSLTSKLLAVLALAFLLFSPLTLLALCQGRLDLGVSCLGLGFRLSEERGKARHFEILRACKGSWGRAPVIGRRDVWPRCGSECVVATRRVKRVKREAEVVRKCECDR
jgi:hypothetical protein